MNEEELKALVGEAAFNAMSADQRKAATEKYDGKAKADKDAKDKKEKEDKEKDDKDNDLREKVRKEKEEKEGKQTEVKGLEKVLGFNMSVANFVKENSDILPSEIPELLKAAEKEKYDTAQEKAGVIKTAFIEAFFAVQAHVDLLTATQKTALDDYLKLTKNGKQVKAADIYENLFEPALETLKKVKKAEELGKARSGYASSSKVEDGYKQRLIDGSQKAYLGGTRK